MRVAIRESQTKMGMVHVEFAVLQFEKKINRRLSGDLKLKIIDLCEGYARDIRDKLINLKETLDLLLEDEK